VNSELRNYLLRFGVGLAALMGFSRLGFVVEQLRMPYCSRLAASLAATLNWIGIPTHHEEATLSYANGALTVVTECDGLVLLVLFFAGVVAAPLPRTWRHYGLLLLSVAVLVAINWVRLLGLALTQLTYADAFETAHHYVFQGILILVTLLLYVAWLRAIEPEPKSGDADPDADPAA